MCYSSRGCTKTGTHVGFPTIFPSNTLTRYVASRPCRRQIIYQVLSYEYPGFSLEGSGILVQCTVVAGIRSALETGAEREQGVCDSRGCTTTSTHVSVPNIFPCMLTCRVPVGVNTRTNYKYSLVRTYLYECAAVFCVNSMQGRNTKYEVKMTWVRLVHIRSGGRVCEGEHLDVLWGMYNMYKGIS